MFVFIGELQTSKEVKKILSLSRSLHFKTASNWYNNHGTAVKVHTPAALSQIMIVFS